MKLHTALSARMVKSCMDDAIRAGRVPSDVHFVAFSETGSRSHRTAFEITLGSYDKQSRLDGKLRRRPNSGSYGAGGDCWAATYDEWGWFMAQVFVQDPEAKFGSVYNGVADFRTKTRHAYLILAVSPVLVGGLKAAQTPAVTLPYASGAMIRAGLEAYAYDVADPTVFGPVPVSALVGGKARQL